MKSKNSPTSVLLSIIGWLAIVIGFVTVMYLLTHVLSAVMTLLLILTMAIVAVGSIVLMIQAVINRN